MRKIMASALLVAALSLFSSCSVVMAAKKEGTSVSNLQRCANRAQFIAQGGTIIEQRHLDNGELIEVYQFKKERGSAARALMHGALDVSTLGLWEVVGTPIEAVQKEEFFAVKVVYDKSEKVKEVILN